MISFTGSTRAGALISENAAKDFKRVSLELGGKGANIIFKDADAEAVERGALRCFRNTGQSCIQDWPVFLKHLKAPLSTASASASLKMILAPFPPSSKLTLLKSLAAFSEIKAPALVDPVNEIIFTSGWLVKAFPVTDPSPL